MTPEQRLEAAIEQALDAHAEYYIRQTVKFFQENGESPAISKDNEGDTTAKAAILAAVASSREEWQTIAGKKVEFVHTAVNGNMHMFIDGFHSPKVCPECIQPGLLQPPTKEAKG